jgi:hypothetical protein
MGLSFDSETTQSILRALPGAGALLVLGLLSWFARRESLRNAGQKVFEYTTAIKILAALFLLTLCGVVLFVEAPWEARDAGLGVIMGLVMNGMALALYFEVFFVRITWDSENIHTRSPWRRSRVIPVAAVKYWDVSHAMQWHRIHTEGHGTIRLPFLGRGADRLLTDLRFAGHFRGLDC